MNEPKASRYHRLHRRAELASLALTAVLLAAMVGVRPSWSVAVHAALLVLLHELVTLPVAFYRHALERRYEVSTQSHASWLKDEAKGLAILLVVGVSVAGVVYRLIAASPVLWWLLAALLGAGLMALMAGLAPLLLLPLFYRLTPLDRPALIARLLELSRRAGVAVVGIYELGLGAKTRRANAALAGAGATRRILLSDTMLAEYTDDEIEVVLAHELAHHVHDDIPKGMMLELLFLLVAGYTASIALHAFWTPLGLRGPADPAGLPLLLLAAGAAMLALTPLAHAFSRSRERRADAFALALTGRHDAFVSAMRRLGQQNLIEESPSRAIVWLFHSHPPVEERIAAAMRSAVRSADQPISRCDQSMR